MQQQHRQQRLCQQQRQLVQPCHAASAAAAVPTAAAGVWPVLVHAWHTTPVAVLLAGAACLLGVALSAFLLASIPTLLAVRRAAHAAERLMAALHHEVPDTAAALRLTSMDVANCIEEVTALGTDLTEGVRASARMLTSAEQGVREGIELAGQAVTGYVVPTVKKKGQEARDVLEGALKERAQLRHTEPAVREMAGATQSTAQRLRAALAAARLASYAAAATSGLRSGRHSREDVQALPQAG
eukprot:scaffold21.g2084.t1